MKETAIICLWADTKEPVAVDAASGGYPSRVKKLREATFFWSRGAAQWYAEVMSRGEDRPMLIVAKVEMTMEILK